LRVWIDSLTPKQGLFFAPLHDLLREQGHSVLVTTRTYRESEQTLRRLRVKYRVVGRHGGGTPIGKLLASGERIVKLAQLIENWKPDVAASFSSVEASRVAFGLGVPHVASNDSPHSWMVARLTIPISAYVCSPWIFEKKTWSAFGAPKGRIVTYRALDPAAWLKRHKPDPRVLDKLGLDRERPIVVLRTEEAFASYLMGRSSDSKPVVGPVIASLLRKDRDLQIVVSTRYGQQAPVLRRRFRGRIIVLDQVIDAASLLSYSDVFIGSGGTMTVEAALLGVPAISCFPGPKPLYIRYLESKGLVRTIKSPNKISQEVLELLRDDKRRERQKIEGTRLLAWMEDPTQKILETVKKAPGKWKLN
jgi:predicted glycosyltransferase